MEGFTVTVDGIRRNEFMQANHFLAMKQYLATAGLLLLLAVSILIVNGSDQFRNLWALLIIIPIVPIVYHFSFLRAYGKQPYGEMEMAYSFDENGWRLTVNGQTGVVAWVNTLKLRRTKTVFLLYARVEGRRGMVSNVLPRRCLTDEQADQIVAWFNAKKI